jgi:oligoribonuclease (3'-5' exoribonuclease)
VGAGIDPKTGRWDWSLGRLAFVDVETTGIWTRDDPPLTLEVAMIVTDGELNELSRYSAVVDYRDLSYLTKASPFVVDMHTKSGLWGDLRARLGTVPLEQIERDLCCLLEATKEPGDQRPVVWAGFSPGALDRPMIRHYMPALHSLFHYRTEQGDPAHRAEKDTEDTIAALGRITSLIERKARRSKNVEPARAAVK